MSSTHQFSGTFSIFLSVTLNINILFIETLALRLILDKGKTFLIPHPVFETAPYLLGKNTDILLTELFWEQIPQMIQTLLNMQCASSLATNILSSAVM